MNKHLASLIPIFFFIIILTAGILVYRDYGIPWDESIQTQVGALNYRYIFKADPALLSSSDRYYGALFELPLLWAAVRLSLHRHLLIFLIFFIGLIVFYALARRLLRNQWWSLLATIMLAASPRIFADAFYNSKDIPFLVVTIMAIWTLILLSDALKSDRGWLIKAIILCLHSMASAAMISTRIAGIMIIPLSLFVLIFDLIKSPALWEKKLAIFSGYLVLTAGLTILFWPVLWHDPWGEFINAFNQMSKYPWGNTVLYLGKFIDATKLPWHYLPVWIGITTPLILLVGFVPGIIAWIKYLFNAWHGRRNGRGSRQAQADSKTMVWTVVVGWLSISITAIYVFHSVLYDGWRQMFFIYPAIVLISILGLRTIYKWLLHHIPGKTIVKVCAGLILLIGLAEPIWSIARYHPYENVYFNVLAGNPATLRDRFELDYWGLSYKQAIDFILANDPGQKIKISVANPPGFDYINGGLSKIQKSRLVQVNNPGDSDYFVSDFRWHPEDYPYTDEFYSIQVRGTKIMVVYRIHQ